MGDQRFESAYRRLKSAEQRHEALHALDDDEVIQALAHASREKDPLLANIVATEALNRMRRSRVIARSMSEGAIAFDEDALVHSVNPAAEAILGLTRAELIGRHWSEITRREPFSAATCPIMSVLKGATPGAPAVELFTRASGDRFWAEWTAAPVVHGGDVLGAVVVVREITQRVEAERRLAALQRVSSRLAMAQTSAEISDIIVHEAVDAVGGVAGIVALANGGAALRLIASRGYVPGSLDAWVQIPLDGHTAIAEAVRIGRTLYLRDPIERARYTPIGEVRVGVGALVSVPLQTREGIVGVLDVSLAAERELHQVTREFVETVAELCAQALRRAVALDRLRHQAEVSQGLLDAHSDLGEGYVITEGGLLVEANDAFVELTGFAREELQSLGTLSAVIEPAALDALRAHFASRSDPASHEHFETRLRRKDGTILHVEASAKPLSPRHGHERMLSIIRDITSRKRAEEALAASHAQRRAIIDAAMDAVVTIDAVGHVHEWSVGATRTFGFTREEAMGRMMADMIIPERLRKAHHDGVARYLARGDIGAAAKRYEMPGLTKEGIEIPVEITIARSEIDPPMLTGFLRDLRPGSPPGSPFHVIANHSPVLVWTATPAQTRTWANPAWLAFVGRELKDVIGANWLSDVHVDDRAAWLAAYQVASDQKAPFQSRFRLRSREGEFRWMLEHAVPEFSASGTFIGHVGCCVDVTDERTDVEMFTSMASHDLRAPMRGVGLLLETLEEDILAGRYDAARDIVPRARRENARAQRLVQDLLVFARAGQAELHVEDIDATALARELVAEIDTEHPEWRVDWRLMPDMMVHADPQLLRIALRNLLQNAAKYSSGRGPAKVEVRTQEEDGRTALSVSDNGVGFAPEETHRLFRPFQRLSSSRGFEGTGLGLLTVQRIVTRHGGATLAQGRPDAGATFTMLFPKARSQSSAMPP